ncbi:MAG: DUF2007 domain-containing protein, partial [Chloroflexi bacterium]|nr:DUF2007 domain-containing protein [Chloroflexota bacterium]
PDRKTWYVVAFAVDMVTAEIPAGLLRSAGIPVFLFREAAGSSAIPVSVGLLGGVDVGVPEAYYDEALALIEGEDRPYRDRLSALESGETPDETSEQNPPDEDV